jgi:hypothetical protein
MDIITKAFRAYHEYSVMTEKFVHIVFVLIFPDYFPPLYNVTENFQLCLYIFRFSVFV